MDDQGEVLNVASVADSEIGRDMSNFAEFPFYYGYKPIRYHSVESFYQMLTVGNERTRKTIAKMAAKDAKRAGNSQAREAKYDGRIYILGSPEHHELMKDVIRAKLEQHPDLARRFVETRPRLIVHNTPGDDSQRLPAAVFCRLLTELREEFSDKLSRAKPVRV